MPWPGPFSRKAGQFTPSSGSPDGGICETPKVRQGVNASKAFISLNPDCGQETVIILSVFFENTYSATIVISFVLVPPGPVTVNVAVYVPALVYSCEAFFALQVCPSPKSHRYDDTVPVDLLVK